MKRIITDNDANGRSRILIEQELPANAMVWEANPDQPYGFDPVEREHTLAIPAGHTICRYVEIPPEAVMAEYLRRGIPGHDAKGFHCTPTLDFFVLLRGRLLLELDEGSAELRPGDVVVQRNTHHAWRNPEREPALCLVIFHRPAEGMS